ncbi:phosphatidylinositol-specific phospholipase C/glycerophosphodiester phosphodiesterase family protein [Niabella soli]|uniref:phosphatidylinositol-specific phospholipase C/glycerophosphodiester phosphodiesterase family protein n=1 Tax=Niabella soli TaxID=446683 RepID=UPI0002498FCC|nr:phosphatidylinositol-specific phospholipase C/glycerophosphodiester phosphodiesterase family protein [Niabella soli]
MRKLLLAFCLCIAANAFAQPKIYTVQNAHSHNDYEQKRPFWLAYEHRFGSIEADVFLRPNELLVAHNEKEIRPDRTLRSLYLDPLKSMILKNKGAVYPDPKRQLVLLIDCKIDGVATVAEIIRELKAYPDIINNKRVRIVITGNQPSKDSLFTYPSFIWFDGDLTYNYTKKNLARVALFSANFRDYSKWDGTGTLDAASKLVLEREIAKARRAGKTVRFWGAPDTPNAWKTFEALGVGYINTDKIAELTEFVHQ